MDRREFSKSVALAGLAGLLDAKNVFSDAAPAPMTSHDPMYPDFAHGTKLTIEKIDIYPVWYPMVMRFKFFEGPVGGSGRPSVILKETGRVPTIPPWRRSELRGALMRRTLCPRVGKKLLRYR